MPLTVYTTWQKKVSRMTEDDLREKLGVVCAARQLIMGEAWVQKVLQLKQVRFLLSQIIYSRVGG